MAKSICRKPRSKKRPILARLAAISREGYDRRIFIRADETAPYGGVAELMATLSSAGYRNLGLVTDPLNAPARQKAGAPKAKAKAAPEAGAPD